MIHKMLIIGLISIILSGCIEKNIIENNQTHEKVYTSPFMPYKVQKYHDNELKVTCWITDNNNSFGLGSSWGGGISCIPDSMIKVNK